MAAPPIVNDIGAGDGTYTPPPTYATLGATPGAVTGPGAPGNIGGSGQVAPPQFVGGPTLPHIPGAQVTNNGGPGYPTFTQTPPLPAPTGQGPPGTIGSPGGGSGILGLFPDYQNSLALQQQGLSQLDAQLNQQRQQAIINFGDPALAQLAGFGLDPQAGAFAQQNYLSGNATLARLDRAHQQAARAIVNQLAAHGILNSGDLGYDQGQENTNYGNNVYDAQQSVLQQLAQLYNSYLGNRSSLENGVNSAQLQALTQFLSNPDAFTGLYGAGGLPGGATVPGAPTEGAATPGKTRATLPKPKASVAPAANSMTKALAARRGGGL